MKKLLFSVCIVSIVLISPSCKPKGDQNSNQTIEDGSQIKKSSALVVPHTPPAGTFTLNGIPSGNADSMVKYFLQVRGSYDRNHPTCVFFKRTDLEQMLTVLDGIKNPAGNIISDGIRFYFARTISALDYTVVAVATTQGVADPNVPSGFVHNDSFLKTNPTPTGGNLSGELGHTDPPSGAILYTPSAQFNCVDNCPKPTPLHYISCQDAHSMIYDQVGPDKINATSEWFDKGVLKALLNLIPNKGGLRLYYARHIKIAPHDTITRHGVVLMVTTPSGNIQQDKFVCLPATRAHYKKLDDGGATDNGEECPTNCQGVTWP